MATIDLDAFPANGAENFNATARAAFVSHADAIEAINTEVEQATTDIAAHETAHEIDINAVRAEIDAVEDAVALATAGSYILVSVNDTTGGDLETKLVAGDNITFTTNNDGANETRTINAVVKDPMTEPTVQDVTAVAALSIDLSAGMVINLDHAEAVTSLAFTNEPDAGVVYIYRDGGTATAFNWGTILFERHQYPLFTTTNYCVVKLTKLGASEPWRGEVVSQTYFRGLAVGINSSPYILLYDKNGKKLTDPAALPPGIAQAVAFSPDGGLLAVGTNVTPYLKVYDTSDWSSVTVTGWGDTGAVYGLAFSHDGTKLAIAHSGTPYATVLAVADWSAVSIAGGALDGVGYCAAWNYADTRLAFGHATSNYLTVYNTSTWAKINITATKPPDIVHTIDFSPDDALFACGDADGYLSVYAASDFGTRHYYDRYVAAPVYFCKFTSDGNYIYTGNSTGLDYAPAILKMNVDGTTITQNTSFMPYAAGVIKGIAINDSDSFITICGTYGGEVVKSFIVNGGIETEVYNVIDATPSTRSSALAFSPIDLED